jgi:hypothetical protein
MPMSKPANIPDLNDRLTAGYSKGLNARQAEFAVQKYCSHRRIGAAIMMNVDMLNNPE